MLVHEINSATGRDRIANVYVDIISARIGNRGFRVSANRSGEPVGEFLPLQLRRLELDIADALKEKDGVL